VLRQQRTAPAAAAAVEGGAGKGKAPVKSKGHQSFDSKAVTADSVASAFAKAEADGSQRSGKSGASKTSARPSRAAKAS